MSTLTRSRPFEASFGVLSHFGRVLASLATSFAVARAVSHEARRLMDATDPQLAEQGLKRDTIMTHIFGKYFATL